MFSEEVDWMRRASERGWSVVFAPEARCVHVGGAAHGGRLFRENVSGHLRYLALHGRPGEAERARRLLRASLLVRGRLYRGERGRLYREVAAWLGSGDAESLIA
jgi:GT2 family glycosyltransferase